MKAGTYTKKLWWILKANRKLLGVLAVAMLIGLGFAAKPAYRKYRGYRIDRNLAAAQAAASQGDWTTARDKARSVLLARRNDFDAFRIWTRACGKLGEPQTYMAAAAFFNDPRASRDDLLEALRMIAPNAPYALVLSAYEKLPKAMRDEAVFRAVLIPRTLERGEVAAAERGLREVMKPGDEPGVRLELLRTLCSRPEAKRVAEARGIFAGLITSRASKEALAALTLLGDVPGGLAPDPALALPAWLKNQPQATAIHHLLGMHPALAAEPGQADTLYQEAVARFLTTEPGVLGTWLARHGKAELAANVLEEPARTRPDAYLARLHVLLGLGKTAEITAALAAPPAGVDPVEMEMIKALLASKTGDRTAAEAAWTQVLNQAALDSSRNRFIEIARVAARGGTKSAAEDAWVAALRLGWGPLPLYQDLLPVLASLSAESRSEDLLAMFQTLLRFEPNNPDLLNNFNYFALLRGSLPPDKIIPVQAEIVKRVDKPEYQATLMLAELMDGRAADALGRLPKFSNSEAVAPMMKFALEGCARIQAGEAAAGSALLEKVDWSGFLRQECSVFRDLLLKSKISGLPLPESKNEPADVDPEQVPAWRKTLGQLQQGRTGEVPPAGATAPVKEPKAPDAP